MSANTNSTAKCYYFTRKENGLAVTRFTTDNRQWRAVQEGNVTVIRFV